MPFFQHGGRCPICDDAPAQFTAEYAWFRDHLLCSGCQSIPRERALFRVLRDLYQEWAGLSIHESSPGGRGASLKLAKVPGYSSSQFMPHVARGETDPATGFRCEDLEAMTFPDASFDLFVTQDVMEHVFDPAQAFREIARVLKPGGAHIFTVPIVNKGRPSEKAATRDAAGFITHHGRPEYHGNPVDAKGALVTMRWGYDLASFIERSAGTPTVIHHIDNIDQGIRAEYIEVLVSFKQ
jgi:SAM-dependent methyltransferase